MNRFKKPFYILNIITLFLAFFYISTRGEGNLTLPLIVLGGITVFQSIRLIQHLKGSKINSSVDEEH